MRNRHRKLLLVLTLIAVVVGGIAVAYFTSSGSGTASSSVGNASTIALSGTAGPLYPGGTAQDVAITVTNPGSGSQYVNSAHLLSITPDGAHSACVVTVSGGNPAFTMADVSVAQTITRGANVVVHGSLTMNDTGVSQDNCQGASLTLNLTSN